MTFTLCLASEKLEREKKSTIRLLFIFLFVEVCCDGQGVNIVPEDFVAKQLKSVLSDMQVDVVS